MPCFESGQNKKQELPVNCQGKADDKIATKESHENNAKTGLDETFQKLSLLIISLSDTSLSGCSSDISMAGLP